MQLACTHFKLTPEEALRGATVNAAKALDRRIAACCAPACARISPWRVAHPAALCYWLGGQLLQTSYADGCRLAWTTENTMRHAPLAASILATLALLAPMAQAQDAATELARDAIIVDTHIDAPGILMDKWAHLGVEAKDREFDYPKSRAGGLDVAFMSTSTPHRNRTPTTAPGRSPTR